MALYKYRKGEVEGVFLAEREQIEEKIQEDLKSEKEGLQWADLKYLTNDDNIIKFVTDHKLFKGYNPLESSS